MLQSLELGTGGDWATAFLFVFYSILEYGFFILFLISLVVNDIKNHLSPQARLICYGYCSLFFVGNSVLVYFITSGFFYNGGAFETFYAWVALMALFVFGMIHLSQKEYLVNRFLKIYIWFMIINTIVYITLGSWFLLGFAIAQKTNSLRI